MRNGPNIFLESLLSPALDPERVTIRLEKMREYGDPRMVVRSAGGISSFDLSFEEESE